MLRVGIVMVLLAASSAAAQESSDEADERARLHFRAGQSHYDAGRFDQAVAEFEASYAIRAHPALQHNIYLAHRDAGRLSDAATALRRFLAEAEDIPNRELLEARLEALEAGESEPPEPTPDTGTTEPPSFVPGVSLLGAAAALGIASAITGARALSAQSRLEERCPSGAGCDPADRSIEDEARRLGVATDVLWPAAAVLGVLGIALTIRAAKRRPSTEAHVSCTSTGCGASIRGSF